MTATTHEPDEVLVGFTRALRAAGVPVTADRSRAYLDAVATVGIGDAAATYAAGRATLCGSPDDLERHDRVFRAWFSAEVHTSAARPGTPRESVTLELAEDADEGHGEGESEAVRAAASAEEVLRHRDVAALSPPERQRLAALFGSLRVSPPVRRSARRVPANRGAVDPSRTLRESLRRMGEPAEIRLRRRGTRARRIVLLLDVSGSMSGYADPLLRLGHRMVAAEAAGPASRGPREATLATLTPLRSARPPRRGPSRRSVEVFTVGTRLTRVTNALRTRDPDSALVAVGGVVPDWSGGTRLGETLRAFVERRRDLARGAVVVIVSDGWERGDPALLAEQVARLRRLAHRVVWVNPHRGKAGYEPTQRGMAAVLPHVDDFLAGHSLATYADLMDVISRA